MCMGNKSVFNGQEERLRELSQSCSSIKEILVEFGCKTNSGNYQTLRKYCKLYDIQLPSMTGDMYTQKAREANKRSLKEILVQDSDYSNNTSLKKRLIEETGMVNQCNECGILPEWNGRRLVLQLDHINGIRTDNRIENLRFLCPNCHSQTDTFCSKMGERY